MIYSRSCIEDILEAEDVLIEYTFSVFPNWTIKNHFF